MTTKVMYGLGPVVPRKQDEDKRVPVYKIEIEDDGTVWVNPMGWFNERETAHAFCNVWNGGDVSK